MAVAADCIAWGTVLKDAGIWFFDVFISLGLIALTAYLFDVASKSKVKHKTSLQALLILVGVAGVITFSIFAPTIDAGNSSQRRSGAGDGPHGTINVQIELSGGALAAVVILGLCVVAATLIAFSQVYHWRKVKTLALELDDDELRRQASGGLRTALGFLVVEVVASVVIQLYVHL